MLLFALAAASHAQLTTGEFTVQRISGSLPFPSMRAPQTTAVPDASGHVIIDSLVLPSNQRLEISEGRIRFATIGDTAFSAPAVHYLQIFVPEELLSIVVVPVDFGVYDASRVTATQRLITIDLIGADPDPDGYIDIFVELARPPLAVPAVSAIGLGALIVFLGLAGLVAVRQVHA